MIFINIFLNCQIYGASMNNSALVSKIDWFMDLKNKSGDEVDVLFKKAAPSVIKV